MPSLYTIPRTRACQCCAAAKSKCEPDIGYTKCKRCNKQGLECILKDPAPRKRRREASTNGNSDETRPLGTPSDSAWSFSRLVELERGLEYYRTALFQYFPFVVPPDLRQPVTEFAKVKPFLATAIAMLGCTEDRTRQRELASQARSYLATHVLQNADKSLDLLQGLLLLSHWYHFQIELKNQRSIYMHLAMGMVVDLELNKSPFARRRLMTASEAANGFDLCNDGLKDHTLEEKRAYLGCLYMSSVLSNASLNMDAYHFSEYAERCCETLEENGLQSDRILVHLCRVQHVVERCSVARSSFAQRQRAKGLVFEFVYDVFRQSNNVDVVGFVDYWDRQLKEQWDAIPEGSRTTLLTIQYGYARVCLHECCLEDSLFTSAVARMEVIQKCIAAIKFLNDEFVPMSERPMELLDVPSHLYAQSNHSMFVAVQLCSVKCGNVSAKVVEKELDLTHIFGLTTERIAGLLESTPANKIPEFYRRLIPMARGIQRWFAAKMRVAEGTETEQNVGGKADAPTNELDLDFLGQFLNLDDNLWLHDLLAGDEPPTIPAL